ncbi:MAG: hypothetical protein AAF599_18950 [Bacteroidota bacterium]
MMSPTINMHFIRERSSSLSFFASSMARISPILGEIATAMTDTTTTTPNPRSNGGSAARQLTPQGIANVENARSRMPTVRMACQEKGVLLGFFIEHEVHKKTKQEREHLFMDASLLLREHEYCHAKIMDKVHDRHVHNYVPNQHYVGTF